MAKHSQHSRPRGALTWVQATIIGAGFSSVLACGSGPGAADPAPTCGPCCHGGGPDCEMMETQGEEEVLDEELVDEQVDADPDAGPMPIPPTCGPCCHGGGPGCELPEPEDG